MHTVTRNCPRDIADKHRHYNGRLKSNVRSPVVLPPYQAEWNPTFCGEAVAL